MTLKRLFYDLLMVFALGSTFVLLQAMAWVRMGSLAGPPPSEGIHSNPEAEPTGPVGCNTHQATGKRSN